MAVSLHPLSIFKVLNCLLQASGEEQKSVWTAAVIYSPRFAWTFF